MVARHNKRQHRHRVNVPGRSFIYLSQWRIQDVPDRGSWSPEIGTKTYYLSLAVSSSLWPWICQCVGMFMQTNFTTVLLKSCKSDKSRKKHLSKREQLLGCPSTELYYLTISGLSSQCHGLSHFEIM